MDFIVIKAFIKKNWQGPKRAAHHIQWNCPPDHGNRTTLHPAHLGIKRHFAQSLGARSKRELILAAHGVGPIPALDSTLRPNAQRQRANSTSSTYMLCLCKKILFHSFEWNNIFEKAVKTLDKFRRASKTFIFSCLIHYFLSL